MKKTFTKDIIIPQRNAEGKILEADGKPIPAKTLGSFTIRHPTFTDQKEIDIAIDRDFVGLNTDEIRLNTYYRIVTAAHFPRLVEIAPEGWDWDTMTMEEGRALYDALMEEVKKNDFQGA